MKWQVNDILGLRASVGKGLRTVHALAENNYLLASGRELTIDKLGQENAWNYGVSAALNIPIAKRTLKVNAEYYYTHFGNQAVIDYDSDPSRITISNLRGRSYSHTFQVDATYDFFRGMTVTAAYRYNNVKSTYGGQLLRQPLTSKYKGLLTASYKTPLGLWQFDATLSLNGGGRMPKAYTTADGTVMGVDISGFCPTQRPDNALVPQVLGLCRWRESHGLQAEEPNHQCRQPAEQHLRPYNGVGTRRGSPRIYRHQI